MDDLQKRIDDLFNLYKGIYNDSLSSRPVQDNVYDLLPKLRTLYEEKEDTFLKLYQQNALKDLLSKVSENISSGSKLQGICEMPTGTGKTAVLSQLLNLIQSLGAIRVIIAVPTKTLVEQTISKIAEYSKKNGLMALDQTIGEWHGTQKQIQQVTVTTHMSLVREYRKYSVEYCNHTEKWAHPSSMFHPRHSDVVVLIDEAHHTSSNGFYEQIKHSPMEKLILGFSGTASDYTTKLPMDIWHKMTYSKAVSDGAISAVQFLDIDFSFNRDVIQMRRNLGITRNAEGLTKEQREKIDNFIVSRSGINATTIIFIIQSILASNPGEKIMMFTNTKNHANSLRSSLLENGIQCVCYHGDMTPAECDTVLNEFKQKRYCNVMISCGMLDEGFDLSSVKYIIDFTIHIKRTRRIVQRLGRAMRLTEDGRPATYVRIKFITNKSSSSAGQINPRKMYDIWGNNKKHDSIGCRDTDLISFEPNHFVIKPIYLNSRMVTPMSARLTFPKTNSEGKKYVKLGDNVPDKETKATEDAVGTHSGHRKLTSTNKRKRKELSASRRREISNAGSYGTTDSYVSSDFEFGYQTELGGTSAFMDTQGPFTVTDDVKTNEFAFGLLDDSPF